MKVRQNGGKKNGVFRGRVDSIFYRTHVSIIRYQYSMLFINSFKGVIS
jgi:hypothetical protein